MLVKHDFHQNVTFIYFFVSHEVADQKTQPRILEPLVAPPGFKAEVKMKTSKRTTPPQQRRFIREVSRSGGQPVK